MPPLVDDYDTINWSEVTFSSFVVAFNFPLEIMQNQSFVTEFVLLGLSKNPNVQKIVFVVFSLGYIATVGGNLLIVGDCHDQPGTPGLPYVLLLGFPILPGCVFLLCHCPKDDCGLCL